MSASVAWVPKVGSALLDDVGRNLRRQAGSEHGGDTQAEARTCRHVHVPGECRHYNPRHANDCLPRRVGGRRGRPVVIHLRFRVPAPPRCSTRTRAGVERRVAEGPADAAPPASLRDGPANTTRLAIAMITAVDGSKRPVSTKAGRHRVASSRASRTSRKARATSRWRAVMIELKQDAPIRTGGTRREPPSVHRRRARGRCSTTSASRYGTTRRRPIRLRIATRMTPSACGSTAQRRMRCGFPRHGAHGGHGRRLARDEYSS